MYSHRMLVAFHVASALLVAVGTSATAFAQEAGDQAKGQKLFARCSVCHSLDKGVNKLGPSLNGVVGRPSASVPGYNYSAAMKARHLIWDKPTLDEYLANAKAVVPGSKMIFPGLPNQADRASVIDYLAQAGSAK